MGGRGAGADRRVPGYLGRILGPDGASAGTCFQVAPGVLVTAWHVLDDLGAGQPDETVPVDALAGGVPAAPARVARIDPLHDLAVLVRAEPLADSVRKLLATDDVPLLNAVVVTGVARVDDPGHDYGYLDAAGTWQGGTTRDDQVPLGRLASTSVLPGMSGAPVVRTADGAVVGIVSARYNSADGWLRDSVWVARTEDLRHLLAGLTDVEVVEGPLGGLADLTLSVTGTRVRLTGAGQDVDAPHGGVRPGLAGALEEVRRARARAGGSRNLAPAEQVEAQVSLRRAGQLLAESFLPEPVARALGRVMTRAVAENAAVRLAVVSPSWSWLPWEALPDPGSGTPLALHPLVTVFRKVAAGPVRPIGGPLRIVVAIASPDTGGGPLLDYERELRNVLSAVRGARQGDAWVHVVPFASTSAIRAALDGGGVHVLHLSAHGGPGALVLEDDEGSARTVDADTFVTEAVPPGGMPPLIALAACYTDAPATPGSASFAVRLAERGAAAVIGTETSVTDRYANRLFARVYAELAEAGTPDVLRAVAVARRTVQQQLTDADIERERLLAGLDEWSVVTVLAAGPSVPLVDAQARTPLPAQPAAGLSVDGLLTRAPGEFVGRRREQRRLPVRLAGAAGAGVVLHGIGGVGKTTLAAEIARRMAAREAGRLVAAASGEVHVDDLLSAVVAPLRRYLLMTGSQSGPVVQAAQLATRVDVSWPDRFDILAEHVLGAVPLLVVLDNFEDNLALGDDGRWTIADPGLAGLLASWVRRPGRSRILVTSRYPFTLPDDAQRELVFHHVGPMTFAETLKLVWSLPMLDRLDDADLERVWRMVGGHPRTLEYLDALLAAGTGRFPDVTRRLATAVRAKLGDEAGDRWLSASKNLDTALAESVTLAADDVLLDEHLTRLAEIPGAVRLLLGASVYREPVDRNALLFQIGEPDEAAARVPAREAARARIERILAEHNLSLGRFAEIVNAEGWQGVPAGLEEQVAGDLPDAFSPPGAPRTTDLPLGDLIAMLAGSSLLAVDEDAASVFVHRWTATELEERAIRNDGPEGIREAHDRAAAYWQWRVEKWPQDEEADVHDLLEARHHMLQAGDIDRAGEVTAYICGQLNVWGAWDHEVALIHDMLGRLPAEHPRRPSFIHNLGIMAHDRGDYEEAERLYRQSLAINERSGNQRGMSDGYHQLGILAQIRRDHAEAERLYQQSLEIDERLGDQRGVSRSYHQLGMLAHYAGDYDEAERLYRRSLAIKEQLDDQVAASSGYHQLGMLAHYRGDFDEAERLYRLSLAIKERLGDQADISRSTHQLGALAHDRGDYEEAERLYRESLAIKERLGDQAGMAVGFHQLGMLAHDRGDHQEAERLYRLSLEIESRIGDHGGVAMSLSQLGQISAETGRLRDAVTLHVQALSIRLNLQIPQAINNIRVLRAVRARLGEEPFRDAAGAVLEDDEDLQGLLDLLDTYGDELEATAQ